MLDGMSIHFINQSSVVDAITFQNAINDINTQLQNEFALAWGLPHFAATLTLVDEPTPTDPPDALGFHDISSFHPFARVFVGPCTRGNVPWPLAASHEALEMCANPLINRVALIDTSGGAGTSGDLVWAEICDAVERASYPGRRHATPLSSFVLPGWFIPGWQGAVDHLGQIGGPLALASGGYIAVESFTGSGWQDVTAFPVQIVKKRKVHYL